MIRGVTTDQELKRRVGCNQSPVRDFLMRLTHSQEGVLYDLARMRRLMTALGGPEARFPAIHIAGTNGKGSTAAHLEAIYRAAGYKTGLYTSPHLVRLEERIQVNRELISAECLAKGVGILEAILKEWPASEWPTFFEAMTALAFWHFAEEAIDMAVVETGLGGRLDATNILPSPLATVITTISHDHEAILGETLAAIAQEKAGIFKAGVPVFLGQLPVEAEAVMMAAAEKLGVNVTRVSDVFGLDIQHYPMSRLLGVHQRVNAGLAVTVVEALQHWLPVEKNAIEQGLRTVDWPGRWQEIALTEGPRLILDGAHNEEGAQALAQQLENTFLLSFWSVVAPRVPYVHSSLSPTNSSKSKHSDSCLFVGKKPTILLGFTSLARARVVIKCLMPYAQAFLLAQANDLRSITVEELRTCVPADFSGMVQAVNLQEIFPRPGVCTWGTREDVLIVTGSMYLVGEVLKVKGR